MRGVLGIKPQPAPDSLQASEARIATSRQSVPGERGLRGFLDGGVNGRAIGVNGARAEGSGLDGRRTASGASAAKHNPIRDPRPSLDNYGRL